MNQPKKKPPEAGSFPLIDRETTVSPDGFNLSEGALFLLDKPSGWTSFRVVGLLRKISGIKKVGHAGTLDPMATGLLVLCCGRATKSIAELQDSDKEYVAGIQFGTATPSYDMETPANETKPFQHITEQHIREALNTHFQGETEQMPPMYSALKVKGERLYHIARRGEEVKRKRRTITIYETELCSFDAATGKAVVRIVCSKGTYIRSIANDLGRYLDSCGCLYSLRRTRSGQYRADQAMNMHELLAYFNADDDINLS